MLGPCKAAQLENVTQDCAAPGSIDKVGGLHGLCNGTDRLTVSVVGVINQCTAIRSWLDLAASPGRRSRFQCHAKILKRHLCRATGSGGGQRYADAMLSRQPQLYIYLLVLIAQCKMASSQRISADVTAAHMGALAKSIVEYPCLCLLAHTPYIAIIIVENGDTFSRKCLYQFTLGDSNLLL